MNDFDIVIIGAGVVGLAVAYELSKNNSKHKIALIETNLKFGQETSSRNSEVIHAGIYYPQNSLKAIHCVEGRELLYRYLIENQIEHNKCTKLIVASDQEEENRLHTISENSLKNGVELRFVAKKEINELEPNVNAVAALMSSETGIVNSHQYMSSLQYKSIQNGVDFFYHSKVVGVEKSNSYNVHIQNGNEIITIKTSRIINSAGLFSDQIASMVGIDIKENLYELSYCKGTYYSLAPKWHSLTHRLIYPVPKKESLGIHAVVDTNGGIKFGPDAHYLQTKELDYSVNENKKKEFYSSIHKIFPQIQYEDIHVDMCGIRPKLQKENENFRDFVINEESKLGFEGFINLIGIESPGLTSSLSIARKVKSFI